MDSLASKPHTKLHYFFLMLLPKVTEFIGDVLAPPRVAGGALVTHRVIKHIAVAVIAFRVRQAFYYRVRTHEAAEGWVVDPATHVDYTHLIEHLMARKAFTGGVLVALKVEPSGIRQQGPVQAVPGPAPRVVLEAFGDAAELICDGHD